LAQSQASRSENLTCWFWPGFEQITPTDATIRIISAREAERVEIKDYEDTPR